MIYIYVIGIVLCLLIFPSAENHLMEVDLFHLIDELGHRNENLYIKRILISFILSISYFMVVDRSSYLNQIIFIFIIVVSFKMQYYYVFIKHRQRRFDIHDEFPLFLKLLEMYLQSVPVKVAVIESSKFMSKPFRRDLTTLIEKSLENPLSIEPYIDISKKYKTVDDFEKVMRLLFRINEADLKQQSKILNVLSTISTFRMRKKIQNKHESKIKALTMIGVAPVIILAIAYTISLIINI